MPSSPVREPGAARAGAPAAAPEFGAWNPGLESELPRELMGLATVFRPENVSTSLAKALELSDFCGLPPQDLVAFRPERLVIHELLVRVTADLAVPDGATYEDLGRNFRSIASTVLNKDIAAHLGDLKQVYATVRREAAAVIARELDALSARRDAPQSAAPRRWGLRGRGARPLPRETAEEREQRTLRDWVRGAQSADSRLARACLRALGTVATAIAARRGRLFADTALITDLALTLVCNDFASESIGEALAPFIRDAALREGYRMLSAQERPVIMNVKGASAAGKSTMRPLQRILAERLGFPWQNFALISPDIWRKFLLDYGSLGPAYKYAGTMTGHEVEIIDKKLDRYMSLKAARGETSHLLIDRFRFDSFVEGREPTRLLTRFGDLVYMFFIITPPEMTVERAWKRGLQVGRYKAVEDLLAHNVEAYTGMPELFFTWALDTRRRVHYEFLDNSVAEGERPLTVAFGWNGEMTILDLKRMLDVDRFRKINIQAQRPPEVYVERELAAERNVEFLQRCARLIPAINFADRESGRVYARMEHGTWAWRDEAAVARVMADPDARAALLAIPAKRRDGAAPAPENLTIDDTHNLGARGTERQT
ncbi:MAG TPA: hypothetical protein VLX44_10175 [Xanthobacteraceae bacterium]|nr:hypothetical protein [Xanthobacteraceae bacterium]